MSSRLELIYMLGENAQSNEEETNFLRGELSRLRDRMKNCKFVQGLAEAGLVVSGLVAAGSGFVAGNAYSEGALSMAEQIASKGTVYDCLQVAGYSMIAAAGCFALSLVLNKIMGNTRENIKEVKEDLGDVEEASGLCAATASELTKEYRRISFTDMSRQIEGDSDPNAEHIALINSD